MALVIQGARNTLREGRAVSGLNDIQNTVQPIFPGRAGIDNLSTWSYELVNTDTVDSSTTQIITAAAHNAKIGHLIRFTSGARSGEFYTVADITTNTIILGQVMSAAPSAGNGFQILRPRYPVLDTSGNLNVNINAASAAPLDVTVRGIDPPTGLASAAGETGGSAATTMTGSNPNTRFKVLSLTISMATGAVGQEDIVLGGGGVGIGAAEYAVCLNSATTPVVTIACNYPGFIFDSNSEIVLNQSGANNLWWSMSWVDEA